MCCLVFASPGLGEEENSGKQELARALLSLLFISCICYCCASFISSNSCIHSSDVAPGPLPNIAPQPVLDVCFDAVLVSLHVLLLLFVLHMLHLLLIVFDAVLVSLHFKVPPKLCCQVGRQFASAPPTGLASCVKCILMCFCCWYM